MLRTFQLKREVFIIRESPSYICQRGGQRQATQGATTRKCAIPDTRQGGGQRQAAQGMTTFKRIIPDARHCIRNDNISSF